MDNLTNIFEQMDISDSVKRALRDMKFYEATPIQAKSIPVILEGRDVIGRSQTGTGKTIAFGIPAIEIIDNMGIDKKQPQVLILCPTRELSMQVTEELRKIVKYKPGVKIVNLYGGAPMLQQIQRLKGGADIVVGTPGRVMDHMERKTLRLQRLEMVVLDEADEMLNMGFKEDVENILSSAPDDIQTILFSATMSPDILKITKEFQNRPVMVEVDIKQPSVKAIKQYYYMVPPRDKRKSLPLILKYYGAERCLVFCNTKKMVDEIVEFLNERNFEAEGLHGDMKQPQRTQVLSQFKSGKTKILVATDVAARGIDVSDIALVVNYDIPQNNEYYIHRIGRTGRAGKSGRAVTLCTGKIQLNLLQEIASFAKSTVREREIPTQKDVAKQNQKNIIKKFESVIYETDEFKHTKLVKQMVERGMPIEKIAAYALELAFTNDKQVLEEVHKKSKTESKAKTESKNKTASHTKPDQRQKVKKEAASTQPKPKNKRVQKPRRRGKRK